MKWQSSLPKLGKACVGEHCIAWALRSVSDNSKTYYYKAITNQLIVVHATPDTDGQNVMKLKQMYKKMTNTILFGMSSSSGFTAFLV
jgi:hypothetical protein